MVAGIAATLAAGALTADAVAVIYLDWARYPPPVSLGSRRPRQHPLATLPVVVRQRMSNLRNSARNRRVTEEGSNPRPADYEPSKPLGFQVWSTCANAIPIIVAQGGMTAYFHDYPGDPPMMAARHPCYRAIAVRPRLASACILEPSGAGPARSR